MQGEVCVCLQAGVFLRAWRGSWGLSAAGLRDITSQWGKSTQCRYWRAGNKTWGRELVNIKA